MTDTRSPIDLVLVPREPTEAMVLAGAKLPALNNAPVGAEIEVYRAMLAAAPAAPPAEEEVERAAKALLEKLDEVGPAIDGAFVVAALHGSRYTGPSIVEEKEALRDALSSRPVAGETKTEEDIRRETIAMCAKVAEMEAVLMEHAAAAPINLKDEGSREWAVMHSQGAVVCLQIAQRIRALPPSVDTEGG